MTITVSSGGTVAGLNISGGDPLVVLSAGSAILVTVLSGGSATVSGGGIAGYLTVYKGGVVEGSGELLGTNEILGAVSGVTLTSSGTLELLSGGTSDDVTVGGQGAAAIFEITSGGSATGTVIESGGLEIIGVGGVASGDAIQSGGTLFLLAGGIAVDVGVQSGGILAYGQNVTGHLTVSSGAVTNAMVLGGVTVSSGGAFELLGATLLSGAVVSLLSGAAASALTISKGAVLSGSGTLGGENFVAGSVSSLTLTNNGYIELSSGGTAGDVMLELGTLQVSSGATATGTVVSGGSDLIDDGSTTDTVVSSGGEANLYAADSGDIVSSSGKEIVRSGGLVSGATVLSGGTFEVVASGTATGAVLSGGREEITSGGVTHATTVLSGGVAYVYAGGVASGDIVSSGAKEIVSSGGVTHGTTVLSGGLEYVYSRGAASGTTLSGGAKAFISAGGSAVSATVFSGGVDYVLASGTTTGTVVSVGGHELVSSGGVASGATVLLGAHQEVYSSGLSVNATIASGGEEVILAGGTASGLTLAGGLLDDDGAVVISGAGSLVGDYSGNGSIVELGGGDLLLSGGGTNFTGSAVISGGTIELGKTGQLGTGIVQFFEPSTGSAVLQIDAGDAPAPGGTFANVISNFSAPNEDIDLRSIAFVAGATATVEGGDVLVLDDGGTDYDFDLAGSIGTVYPVVGDGHGGTLIDPRTLSHKVMDPKVLAFAHAAAAFAPSDAANAALVSSTSPGGHTPFLHATASATAGRF